MFNVVIAGGRDFDDYALLKSKMDSLLSARVKAEGGILVISGGAKGADTLGEKYAEENELIIARFTPDWDRFGKAAGPKRNAEMAKAADAVVVFWDGASRGSMSMIEEAKKHDCMLRVVRYQK